MKPLSFLYICVAILCIVGPISYGTASLIYDLCFPSAVQCSAIDAISAFIYLVGHTMLCFSIGLIAVVQFMTVDVNLKSAVSVRNLAIAYLVLLIIVFSINVIFFCAVCVQGSSEQASTAKAVWTLLMFALPLITITTFSVLTYFKVKKGIVEDDNKIVRSIALVSAFNVLIYALLRLFGLVLYILSYTIPNENGATEWYTFLLQRHLLQICHIHLQFYLSFLCTANFEERSVARISMII